MSTNITLRGEKGSALTYAEMDENFVSFFYSASLNTAGTELTLYRQSAGHITDSVTTDHKQFKVPLVPISGSTPVTGTGATSDGATGVIQLSDGAGGFNSNSLLSADAATGNVGIGDSPTASYRLKVVGNSNIGGIIQHKSVGSGTANLAFSEYSCANTTVARVGKISATTNNTYWHTFGNSSVITTNAGHRFIGAQNGAVAGNDAYTHRGSTGTNKDIGDLVVVGSGGLSVVGNSTDDHSVMKPIAQESSLHGIQLDIYNNNSCGLLLAGKPKSKGNVIIGVNADSGFSETFTVFGTHEKNISSCSACYTTGKPILIGKLTDTTQAQVIINECVKWASNKTLHLRGSACMTGDVFIGEDLAVTGSLNLVAGLTGSTALSASYDASDIGTLVQRTDESIVAFDAAPIPKGGIIMWSGAISDIPSGWQLCDGTGTTPDLTDKFVIGATSDGADSNYPALSPNSTGGSADAVVVSHNHGGTTSSEGSHVHTYKDTMFTEEYNSANRVSGIDNIDTMYVGKHRNSTTDTNGSNLYSYSIDRTTSSGGSHQHTITSDGVSGTNKNLPPYYALAFIMYVG